jgi:hypothetical protein
MEEWFLDSNNKVEVINVQPQIANVLRSLQQSSPRNTNTNRYNLPKMYGFTKIQEYMMLFGSEINFCGGPGESAHKQFYQDREYPQLRQAPRELPESSQRAPRELLVHKQTIPVWN